MPPISPLHPRIYIRARQDAPGTGLTLDALRARITDKRYAALLDRLPGRGKGEGLCSTALRYLLYGDVADALYVGERIAAAALDGHEHTADAGHACDVAVSFDWVANALPAHLRNACLRSLAAMADAFEKALRHPSIQHNYTYVSLQALCTLAMALSGEGQGGDGTAQACLGLIDSLLTGPGGMFETLRNKGGTWGEGNHYSPYVVFHPFLYAVKALDTAGDFGYFARIRREFGDFLPQMARFIIMNFRPDFTMERIGDTNWNRPHPAGTVLFPTLALLAGQLEGEACGQLHAFMRDLMRAHGPGAVGSHAIWQMLIFYDAGMPDTPGYEALPLTLRSAPGGQQQLVWRSGWQTDSTMITLTCGEHITDHQHFDQGNLLIYKKGALLVDSGGYSRMYNNHWQNYACRTLAHNTLLVHDAQQQPTPGIDGVLLAPDGGQRVIRSTQSDADWPAYEATRRQANLSTAYLALQGEGPGWRYAAANLTQAYGDAARQVWRTLLYLEAPDVLLVRDTVLAERPVDSQVLFHFEQQPQVAGVPAPIGVTGYQGRPTIRAIRTGQAPLAGMPLHYDGALHLTPLFPLDARVYTVGGEGYRFYNRYTQTDYPPEQAEQAFVLHPVRESGCWRAEIGTPEPCLRAEYLTALQLAATQDAPYSIRPLTADFGRMQGAIIEAGNTCYVAMFPSGQRAIDEPALSPIRYTCDTPFAARHILCGLCPSYPLRLTLDGLTGERLVPSAQGVVCFEVAAGCHSCVLTPAL
nr:heparinase II/III family protein [bacterium]